MRIELFKKIENELSSFNKKRRLRLNADFNIEKMNNILQIFRIQMIYAQVYQQKYVNRRRKHVFKRQVENLI